MRAYLVPVQLLLFVMAISATPFTVWMCSTPGGRATLAGVELAIAEPLPRGITAAGGYVTALGEAIVVTTSHVVTLTTRLVDATWPGSNASCAAVGVACVTFRGLLRADGTYLNVRNARRDVAVDVRITGKGEDGRTAVLDVMGVPVIIADSVASSAPSLSAVPLGADWSSAPAWLSVGTPLQAGSLLGALAMAAAARVSNGSSPHQPIRVGYAFQGAADSPPRGSGSCGDGTAPSGAFHLGSFDPPGSIQWGVPLIAPSGASTRMLFQVFDLALCGVPLLGGVGAPRAWFAEVDLASACLTLPAPAYDALMAWAPLRPPPPTAGGWSLPELTVDAETGKLPSITFAMRPDGPLLVLPLRHLVVPAAAVTIPNQTLAARPRLCVLRGSDGGAAKSSYLPFFAATAPLIHRVSFGSMALRGFYVAFDGTNAAAGGGGRVGLAQGHNYSNVSVSAGCAAAASDCGAAGLGSTIAFFAPMNECRIQPWEGTLGTQVYMWMLAIVVLVISVVDARRMERVNRALAQIVRTRLPPTNALATT